MTIWFSKKIKVSNSGMGLIDVVVGTSLMLLVFVSIFSVFKLSIELIAVNKTKIGALSLMQEQVEYMRSLSYDNVGTIAGIPAGDIPQSEVITLNGIEYTRKVLIQYVDNPKDGLGIHDENGITSDYKVAKVTLSWNIRGNAKEDFFVTNIVPKGIETLEGGGTLTVNVFDANGISLPDVNVNIVNNSLNPAVSVDVSTNEDGRVMFPGSPSSNNYEITVTKAGYSTAQTYDVTVENTNPNPGHISVLEGETTVISFQIDKVSSKTIRTFTPITAFAWTDIFDDLGNVGSSTNIVLDSEQLQLFEDTSGYSSTGLILTTNITHPQVYTWESLSWNDDTPIDTDILYQVYYESEGAYFLIPDDSLTDNSVGFTTSPVDLTSINVETYPILNLGAILNTSDASSTPAILDWSVDYTAGPIPFPNVPFNMHGEKEIGENAAGDAVYKYNNNLQTNSSGVLSLINLEWDNYNVTIDNAGFGYDFKEACLPQPRSLSPDTATTTDFLLVPHTTYSLLVDIVNTGGFLLEGAEVRLYENAYDVIQETSDCGQVFFNSLSLGTVENGKAYSMRIELAGYTTLVLTDVDVAGTSKMTVVLY